MDITISSISGFWRGAFGQDERMRKRFRRSAIAAAAFAPVAAMSVMASAIGSAQPLNCQNGEWWDAVDNICRPPVATAPLACAPGEYWNPVKNVCRPLGQY
ncbi:hypothetical protein MHOL44478_10015 [Mycobacterium holsaticum DSM 44478]|nr:hypothetical protein [Mycolicibacterium holsaticum DSM 44478 = JCM 12374]